MSRLGMKNRIIWYLFGGIIQKIATFGDKIHISGLFILSLPVFIFTIYFLFIFITNFKKLKKTIDKFTFIYGLIALSAGFFTLLWLCISDQVNRVNLGIPVDFNTNGL